jgi:hypothetical protein
VNHRLRLSEPVLRLNAAGMPRSRANARQKKADTYGNIEKLVVRERSHHLPPTFTRAIQSK